MTYFSQFYIKMPPGSTWDSKDWEEPIEFESIAKFYNHQVEKELLAKNHRKIVRNHIKRLFFDGFLLISHF